MEVGFLPKVELYSNFEQVSKTNTQKVHKTVESDPSFLLKEGSELNDVTKISKSSEFEKIKPVEGVGNFTEVKLYNSDFGFNESSKDFFIKVERGAFVDNKYPTDELMRLKSYLNEQNKSEVA